MEWSGNPEQSSTPATAESVSACSIPHMDHALETTGGYPSVFTSTRFSTLPMRVQIFVARHNGCGRQRSASSRREVQALKAVRPSAKRLPTVKHAGSDDARRFERAGAGPLATAACGSTDAGINARAKWHSQTPTSRSQSARFKVNSPVSNTCYSTQTGPIRSSYTRAQLE